jgi:hypothetical protein
MPSAPLSKQSDTNTLERSRAPIPDYLDQDMTIRDLVTVLEGLRFNGDGWARIELDRAVADFLVALLQSKTRRW